MNIIELPDGIAKPEHAAIFEPRAPSYVPTGHDRPQFFVTYPHPDGGVNNRGDGPRMTIAKSNKRPFIVIDDVFNVSRWAALIEDCKIINIDPHILFVGRPLRIAIEPHEWRNPMDREYDPPRVSQILCAIHVGGTFDKHKPLDDLVRTAREWF